ncbi:MAG TPA: HAMP domain-containing sensor histidine kinase [Candidatus Binatia bacterium]|nr:HAMP domain-containing sensor histidine kinase [Candidatus Binatia bacterium]
MILVLPLGGIAVLRIYESALIRQTESELLAQGAFVATTYKAGVARHLRALGRKAPAEYGLVPTERAPPPPDGGDWRPYFATLDLASDPVYDAPPDAAPALVLADDVARKAGEELQPILHEVQNATLAGFTVVDANGTVVAATNLPLGVSILNHEEIVHALAGRIDTRLRRRVAASAPPPLDSISRGARIRVFVAVPIELRERIVGAVLLVRTPANIKQAIYGKRRPLAWAGALLVGLVALLSLFTSLTINRPVQDLAAKARRAARGELGAMTPLRHAGTREIAELSEDVAAMARTLEERADYIRSFAAHVSHEFKTPLTAIQGAVELLREHAETMSAEERARFLGILSSDAQRLENLVRRLLELARADVMHLDPAQRADAAAVLAATVQRYREHGLQLELPPTPPRAQVAMAPETLDSIVSNLLDNARQHAGANARVSLDMHVEHGELAITVADDGPGISEANRARIFEPFFTTARQEGNTGLGLPIIRALLQAHRGRVVCLPRPRGAAFRITLPLSPDAQV